VGRCTLTAPRRRRGGRGAEPAWVIFIGTYEFQPAKAEDFKTYWKEFWSTVVAPQEPRLLAFNAYVDADNKRVTVVQVHPDAESMAFHMSLITEHVAKAYGEPRTGRRPPDLRHPGT